MKMSNFKMVKVEGINLSTYRFTASVTVKEFLRKPRDVLVHRQYGGSWFFVDSGKFTPSDFVESLARSYSATNGPLESFKCSQ